MNTVSTKDDRNIMMALVCDKCFKPLPYVDITAPINCAHRSGFREGIAIGVLIGGATWAVVAFFVR